MYRKEMILIPPLVINPESPSAMDDILFNTSTPRNVVWQITELTEFRRILPAFIEKAAAGGQKIAYIHFSEKAASLVDDRYIREQKVHLQEIPLSHRFEGFSVSVYQTIWNNGHNVLYIFDCLSELQTAWATDLMMENFFRVITPAIRSTNSQAFFPLIRGLHSSETKKEIQRQTRLFLDLYSDFNHIYMRPIKIYGMPDKQLVPHIFHGSTGHFEPIQDAVLNSRFQRALNLTSRMSAGKEYDEHKDAWDRFFDQTQRDFEMSRDISTACERMSEIMMSRDPRIREMIRDHFRPEDYFFVKEHMVGTGLIGGKACGMLVARRIIENRRPDIFERMEPHDSFFIGSDVFYSYIVENDFWDLRVRQKTKEGYFDLADSVTDKMLHGTFSRKMKDAFIQLLEYYGHSPIIVRSSSILEDGFGNAFAGKYESVFCPGVGTMEDRLAEFEQAIRIVYASSMSRSALDYRLRRGLAERDEQMALLVMRVSGSHYGSYFMPCAAGVGYSYSTYRFLESLDPAAGMLRLVMGLGTSAVDRTEGSYPRLVSLDKPEATSFKSLAEHHRYSQQNLELINKETGKLEQLPVSRVLDVLPKWLKKVLLGHDLDAERRFRDRGIFRDVLFVNCQGLVKNKQLMKDMQDMMAVIQEEYQQPVDIEFTMNLSEDGDYIINLLQCRPLQVFRDKGRQLIPEDLAEEDIFIDCTNASMGQSQRLPLYAIVYVDPVEYYKMPYNDKNQIARIIGSLNWYYRNKNKNMLLMVPGRICTSSPELGVPSTYSDISEFKAIFEISESRVGYSPELSYGSHIFQDLVENGILYMAVFEDDRTRVFYPERFTSMKNHICDIVPEAAGLDHIIGFYLVGQEGACLYHDLMDKRLVCAFDRKEVTP